MSESKSQLDVTLDVPKYYDDGKTLDYYMVAVQQVRKHIEEAFEVRAVYLEVGYVLRMACVSENVERVKKALPATLRSQGILSISKRPSA